MYVAQTSKHFETLCGQLRELIPESLWAYIDSTWIGVNTGYTLASKWSKAFLPDTIWKLDETVYNCNNLSEARNSAIKKITQNKSHSLYSATELIYNISMDCLHKLYQHQ